MRQTPAVRLLLSFLLLLYNDIRCCSAQADDNSVIGVDICGCQPATYTFEFDFDLVCDDGTIRDETGGVNQTACLTVVRGRDMAPATAQIPVSVQNVQVFELDQSLQVVSQTVKPGTFRNGDTFTYTSILQTAATQDASSLPRGLQMVVTGVNEDEEAIVNTFIITYTNDCGVFPVLEEGQRAGWIVFTDLGDPPQSTCPLSPLAPPTLVPTMEPAPPTPTPPVPTSPPTPTPPTPTPPTPTPQTPTYEPTKQSIVVVPTKPTRPPACVGKGYQNGGRTDTDGEYPGKGKASEGKGGGGKGLMKKVMESSSESSGKGRRGKSSGKGGGKGGMMKMIGEGERRNLGVQRRPECEDNYTTDSRDYGATDSRDSGKGGKGAADRRKMMGE